MESYLEYFDTPDKVPTEYLSVDHKRAWTVRGSLRVVCSIIVENSHSHIYIPTLDLSASGVFLDGAMKNMAENVVQDYFIRLMELSPAKIRDELKLYGWKETNGGYKNDVLIENAKLKEILGIEKPQFNEQFGNGFLSFKATKYDFDYLYEPIDNIQMSDNVPPKIESVNSATLIGSIVQLKSGGPQMVISSYVELKNKFGLSEEEVVCVWHVEGSGYHERTFNVATLMSSNNTATT